jgi:hypothetical protein
VRLASSSTRTKASPGIVGVLEILLEGLGSPLSGNYNVLQYASLVTTFSAAAQGVPELSSFSE